MAKAMRLAGLPSVSASEERPFEKLVKRLGGERDVSVGTGFGKSRGLRVGGKVFAILGGLVVKLPKRESTMHVQFPGEMTLAHPKVVSVGCQG